MSSYVSLTFDFDVGGFDFRVKENEKIYNGKADGCDQHIDYPIAVVAVGGGAFVLILITQTKSFKLGSLTQEDSIRIALIRFKMILLVI